MMQKYKSDYNVQYPVIRQSEMDCYHAFCTGCSADISVAHGGIGDVKKQVLSSEHRPKLLAKLREAKPMTQFFGPLSDMSVINAEVLFTKFLLEHNVAFAASGHARKHGCGHTKTASMIESLELFIFNTMLC